MNTARHTTERSRGLASIAGAVVALVLSWAPRAAQAQDIVQVDAQVTVILAREVAGVIDPRLEHLAALRQPPFNSFHSMDVYSVHDVTLAVGVPSTIDLPNGRVLQLVLEEITPDGRSHLRVSINRRSQSDYLPVLEVAAPPGDPFFVAGQNFQGGTLVIGVQISRQPSGAH
jgi:hypothetical protein